MKNNYLRQFLNRYFDQNYDIRIQSFNVLTFAGVAAGIITAVTSVVTNAGVISVIINLAISLFALLLLWIAKKKQSYIICSWIAIILVFMIAFPALFFAAGGYRSGMPSFFMLALIFTAIILDENGRTAALIIEFAIYITCCLIAFLNPNTVITVLSDLDYFCDVIVGLAVSGFLVLAVVLLRSRFFHFQRKQMKELINELTIRSDTLEQYDRMKSEFLATVAHEINTPLAVISASSNDTLDLLKESPLDMNEIIENQGIIIKRVKLIDNIILDLMDAVAIENGRLALSRNQIDMSRFLEDVCYAQFRRIDNNNNILKFALQPDLKKLWVDAVRLEQVMINLLSNAAKHTKRGEILISLKQSEKSQTVSVTDNGEGMDTEMGRIALRQYASTKADYWRHGIGLYVCRQIITSHDGKIWIESEKGRGTTVSFLLKEEPEHERR